MWSTCHFSSGREDTANEKRTDAAKRYKKVDNATAVIWKLLLVAERRFRRLNAPERVKQVYLGIRFEDGIEVKQEEVAAA